MVPLAVPRGVRMSNRYVNLVLGAQSFGHASRRQVMHVMADHADANGRCFPGLPLLQEETELSKRTLVRCLSDLEGAGSIRVERSSVGPKRRGNGYVLNLKKLQNSQRPSKGAMVSPLEDTEECPVTPQTNGATVTPIDQNGDCNGATVSSVMVPLCPPNGAKSASLYRRTPNNPHRNHQGESTNENKAPLSVARCAEVFFERIGSVATKATRDLAGGAIKILANRDGITHWEAMLRIESAAVAAKGRGIPINNFWFQDDKWTGLAAPTTNSRPDPTVGMLKSDAPPPEDGLEEVVPPGADTELGARIWNGMNKALKSELPIQSYETWIKPIKPLGAMNGELYLQIPSPDFAHVADRYDIASFLPAGVEEIRLLSATGVAA